MSSRFDVSLLIDVAMHGFGRIAALLERGADRGSQRHRAVPPSGATESDRQIAFSFADIQRDQIFQQTFDALQKLSGLRKRANVPRDARIEARIFFEPRNDCLLYTSGIRAILLHAISDEAKRFYERYGFQSSPLDPMTLMITVADARKALSGK